MKRNKVLILISLCIIPLIYCVVFADLGGTFAHGDIPFVIALLFYTMFVRIQNTQSKTTFTLTLFFLVWMGLSWVPTGAGIVTERIGEWFYLFFVIGLIQYMKESFQASHSAMENAQESTDWDTYFTKRFGDNRRNQMKKHLAHHAQWYINWLSYIHTKIPIYNKALQQFEIGSGMGGVIFLLHKRGMSIVGSDISRKAQQTFRRIMVGVPYKICDIQTTTISGGPYDRVLAFEVLEHLYDLNASVVHIKKALRTGGYFVGTTPYPYTHTVAIPTHIEVHGPHYWKQLFLKHGFSSVKTYPMSLPPFLWRIHATLNVVLPVYVPFPSWISTTLIVAKK